MGRHKGDGRGRLSNGRKGIPNKDKPLKASLRQHSEKYFQPRPQTDPDGTPRKIILSNDKVLILADSDGNPLIMSDFDVDTMQMSPAERVAAEIKLLKFHTPEMKSVDVDMDITANTTMTIESRLRQLIEPTEEK